MILRRKKNVCAEAFVRWELYLERWDYSLEPVHWCDCLTCDAYRQQGMGHVWDERIYPNMKKALLCALLSSQDFIEYRKVCLVERLLVLPKLESNTYLYDFFQKFIIVFYIHICVFGQIHATYSNLYYFVLLEHTHYYWWMHIYLKATSCSDSWHYVWNTFPPDLTFQATGFYFISTFSLFEVVKRCVVKNCSNSNLTSHLMHSFPLYTIFQQNWTFCSKQVVHATINSVISVTHFATHDDFNR